MIRSGDIGPIFKATKILILPCTVIPTTLSALMLGKRAGHAVALVQCAWLCTEIFNHLLKILARRMRPVVALRSELADTQRHFPALQSILSIGETAFQSFPSGDAGGAMAFSYVLYRYGAGHWVWSLAFLSSFGRLFLHAHHFFDVVAGCLLCVWTSRYLVDFYGLEEGLNALHVGGWMLAFVAFHLGERKFLPFEIPAEFRGKGESIYGRSHDS